MAICPDRKLPHRSYGGSQLQATLLTRNRVSQPLLRLCGHRYGIHHHQKKKKKQQQQQ
jgi:hypothetical protein